MAFGCSPCTHVGNGSDHVVSYHITRVVIYHAQVPVFNKIPTQSNVTSIMVW